MVNQTEMKAIWQYIGILFLTFTSLFWGNKTYAQTEIFELLDEKEIVHFRLEFYSSNVGVFFLNLPPTVLNKIIVIQNLSRSCTGRAKITGSQILVELSEYYQSSDTFAVYLSPPEWGELVYPTEYIIGPVSYTHIKLGENCYKLRCEPRNDPWMPNSNQPFLFSKNSYYLNPQNGRKKKKKRAIHSGLYSSCDLQEWYLIAPVDVYYDKNLNKHTGSDLISKRRIKTKDWDMRQF